MFDHKMVCQYFYYVFLLKLLWLVTYIVDDKKEKHAEGVHLKKSYIYSLYLYLCDKVFFQKLIYSNLAMFG